ncbi:MAG: tetratricopeptide repeat protein [Planctomycetes bacterium]|nr:tetratricopeptide repeat protein [Planctomycetota bacterium]
MRRSRTTNRPAIAAVAVCVALALVAGCRLPGMDGPVSKDLATSRQLSHRGLSAMERGDRQTAQQILARAVDVCPSDVEARQHYAESLWQNGKQPGAVEQIDAALKLAPDNESLHVRAGQMHLAMNDIEIASSEADQAIRLNSKSPGAWRLRGQIAARRGNLRQALAGFHRAVSYDPHDRELLIDVAETYRQLGQPQQALVTLHEVVDTYSPGDEPQRVLLLEGLALSAMGRNNDAAERLAQARDRGPASAEICYHLAQAQAASGQSISARASLEQALQLEPAHVASQTLLTELSQRR